MVSKKMRRRGSQNQKQGIDAEAFVMNKLKKHGWIVIQTQGSKSPLDIIAHHGKKKLWWGIQVKSTSLNMTFDMDSLLDLCEILHFRPVLAFVKMSKRRDVQFCMKKGSKFYHILLDGMFGPDGKEYHELGREFDCSFFKQKLSIRS